MAITDRTLIVPGVTLTGRYKGTDFRLQVQANGDRLAFVLPNLPAFTSLSKAASAVCKGISRNGWDFWTIEDGEPAASATMPAETVDYGTFGTDAHHAGCSDCGPDVEVMARGAFQNIVAQVAANIAEAQPRNPKAKPAPGPKMVRCIKRVPNQNAVPEGMIKHYCSSCMASFLTEDKDPQVCAVGHPKMQADDLEPNAEGVTVE